MFGSIGKQPFISELSKAQKALDIQKIDAISGKARSVNDSLRLSQDAFRNTQNAFATGSTLSQGVAIGSLSKQLGNALRSSYQLQSEMTTAFSDNAITATSKFGGAIDGITKVTDVAGAMADLAMVQMEATRDFVAMQKVLMNPSASISARITASAKATKSASDFITKQNAFLKALTPAEKAILQNSDDFQALTAASQNAKFSYLAQVTQSTPMQKALYAAEVGGSSAAFILSAFSLPKLVQGTRDRYQAMVQAIENPDATTSEKVEAVAETARAGAGSLYAFKGIGDSFTGIVTALKKSGKMAPLMAKAEGSAFANSSLVAFSKTTIGKIVHFLLPIADVGIAMADTVKAYKTYEDDDATFVQKARATLDVGFDLIKVLTYILPQTRAMRFAYMGASFAQMGLATYDIATGLPSMLHISDDTIADIEARAVSFEQKLKDGIVKLMDRIFGDD